MQTSPRLGQPSLEDVAAQRILVPIFFIGLIVLLVYVGFSGSNLTILLAIPFLPALVYLVNRPAAWVGTVIALYSSSLILPGLPQGLQLYHVLAAGLMLLGIATHTIRKSRVDAFPWSNFFLLGFFGIVALTIFMRGIGIRALGSALWGGMGYVELIIMIFFYLGSTQYCLTPRQWKKVFIGMLVLSAIPAIGQLLFTLSGGAIYQQYDFINAPVGTLLGTLQASETGRGVVRYQLFGSVAQNIFFAALVFLPYRGARRFVVIGLVLISIVLGGMSGFRSIFSTIGLTLFFYFMLPGVRHRVWTFTLLAVAGIFTWLLLIPIGPNLPDFFQRAISWLPFVHVQPHVLLDAQASTAWRLQVWRMAWAQVPDYLWIGKGLAFSADDLMASYSPRVDSALAAFLVHNYHSGPLSLLLDFGILGILTASGFLIASCVEYFRGVRAVSNEPFMDRAYRYVCAQFMAYTVSFFVIFGDARSSIVMFLMYATILRGLLRTARAHSPAPQPVPRARPARVGLGGRALPAARAGAWAPPQPRTTS